MLSRQALRRLPSRWPGTKPRRSILALSLHHRDLATPAQPPSPNDLFANGTNAYYVEEMYRHWRQDPKSVHVSWDVYFSGLDKGLPSPQAFQPVPRHLPSPADGSPAIHIGGGGELLDHLKVSRVAGFDIIKFILIRLGAIACSCLPSARTSRR